MVRARDDFSAISSYGLALATALGERDGHTRHHCDRVVELAGGLGRHWGIDRDELHRLRLCALFHDIGKIGIPDRILLKPGRLDRREWTTMRTHPERGQRIVAAIGVAGIDEIALAVRHHHEHFDGGGYPDGLAGDAIPFIARAVAIVDGYDAMATPRPYHPARGHEAILDILHREAGSKYDPALLACFEEMIEDSSRRAPSA